MFITRIAPTLGTSLKRSRPLAMSVRIVADALLVNCALLLALTLRYLWPIPAQGVTGAPVLHGYAGEHQHSFWLLTLISLLVFSLSGFYTHGRLYRGRYKALIVAQAVTLSFLVYTCVAFLVPAAFPLPRAALVLSWAFTLLGVGGARLLPYFCNVIKALDPQPTPGAPAIRRVLVIGGAGYIGSALIPKLLDNGYHVRVLDLLLFGTEPIAPWLEHPRLEVIKADFRQVDTVVRAMRNIDAVIHLGAIVGDPACALDEELTIEVNLMATRMIAEVAKGSGVGRFIFASTCSVYGASDEILDERSALNPVSLYARSKIACEKVLHKMADDQFAPVIVRFGTVHGLSGRTRFDLVVNLLTAKAVIDREITVMGGDQWRPFLHVDDAAQAVFMALEAPPALVANQVFNVGADDQNYTISQVGEIIHRLVPTAKLIDLGSDADRRNYRVSFSHIRRQLGFVPRYTVARGVQQVLQAFAEGRVTDYRAASYSNVKFLNDGGKAQLVRCENGWATDLLHETAPPMAHAVGARQSRVS